ncbi:hypothetical protein [Terrabacter sp. BE26]|uniref:hypothetical protein n=1 Tax=Terrabacter sp. BE26 TaxID=2898152 RepID=UPI0035BE273A
MPEKKGDADEKRAKAAEARRHGMSASEAGVSTGASKQREHLPDKKREPKGDRKS